MVRRERKSSSDESGGRLLSLRSLVILTTSIQAALIVAVCVWYCGHRVVAAPVRAAAVGVSALTTFGKCVSYLNRHIG